MLNKIILASKSKVRKEILDKNNISCKVEASNIDEDVIKESFLKEGATPETISKNLTSFQEMSTEEILDQRKNKFLKIGRDKGFISDPKNLSSLENKKNIIDQFFIKNKKTGIIVLIILVVSIISTIFLL